MSKYDFFCGPYFPVFGLTALRKSSYSVRIQENTEQKKLRHFSGSVIFLWFAHLLIVSRSLFIAYFCVSFTTEKIKLLLANIFKIKDILDDKYKKIVNKEYKEYMGYKE